MQAKVELNLEVTVDLAWWIGNIMSCPGKSLICATPTLVIFFK